MSAIGGNIAMSVNEMCIKYWEQFNRVHGTQKMQLVKQNQQQLNRLQVQKLVKEIERQKGRQVKAFKFTVDFVVWPVDYKREVSESLLILGTEYTEARRLEELRAILGKYIERLA